MLEVEDVGVTCPYCGESVELQVDCPEGRHEYIEDCQVCCRPMVVEAIVEPGCPASLKVMHEDDV